MNLYKNNNNANFINCAFHFSLLKKCLDSKYPKIKPFIGGIGCIHVSEKMWFA